ncbi:hypothetical protein BDF22DRAFT_657705 [Syncephalis plumigaleata]|nr:hypothetical protein BDF22DRAFT_657705 [Syncephalis plumigaleata]
MDAMVNINMKFSAVIAIAVAVVAVASLVVVEASPALDPMGLWLCRMIHGDDQPAFIMSQPDDEQAQFFMAMQQQGHTDYDTARDPYMSVYASGNKQARQGHHQVDIEWIGARPSFSVHAIQVIIPWYNNNKYIYKIIQSFIE